MDNPRRKKQEWRVGDVFLVPNRDGLFTVGQIVAQERDVLNSVSSAFFDLRVTDPPELDKYQLLPLDRLIAVLFVTRDLLDSGVWRVVGQRPIATTREELPFEHLRERGFVGAKVIGSAIVREFLDAYQGLTAWDDWQDPEYLDQLLISPDRKPKKLILKRPPTPKE